MSQTLQSVLCITTNKYLVHVLVVLLHARFSVIGPIPFLLAAFFFSVHPYIGSTTVLPDYCTSAHVDLFYVLYPLVHVQLEVNGKDIQVEAAVSPSLPVSVLLRIDV